MGVSSSGSAASNFGCVWIPFNGGPPRYKSEGADAPICLRTPFLLSIAELGCMGLRGEWFIAVEGREGER